MADTSVNTATDFKSLFTLFFGSLIAVWVAKEVLYRYTNHAELWMLLFLIASVYILLILTGRNFLYSKSSKSSKLWKTRHDELLFMHLTVVLIVLRLALDYLQYSISVTRMKWSDYSNIITVGLLFIFVLLQKLQQLFKI